MTKITAEHLARTAYVYIRQSTPDQLVHNKESQRRSMRSPIALGSSAGLASRSSMMTLVAREAASPAPALIV